jgi:hypothetical protein
MALICAAETAAEKSAAEDPNRIIGVKREDMQFIYFKVIIIKRGSCIHIYLAT